MTEQPENSLSIEELILALSKVAVTDDGPPGGNLSDLSLEKILFLESRVARVLATLRSAINLRAAVNRLPVEVLGKILELCDDHQDLVSATQVCGRWRSALLSTPSLWSDVVFGNPERALTYIHRSKSTLLSVFVSPEGLEHEGFEDTCKLWIGRAKTLHVTAARPAIEWFSGQLSDLQAPVLQSLILAATDPFHGGKLVRINDDFLSRQAPLLRELILASVTPSPITNIPLQNLTSLRWEDRFSSVAIEELLALLTSAPLLETIDFAFQLQYRAGVLSEKTLITLSQLRKLTWMNHAGPFSFVPFLVTPLLNDMVIRIIPGDPPDANLSIILPPRRDQFPLLVEPTALKYFWRDFNRSCHFTYASGQLTVHELLDPARPAAAFGNWFSPNMPINFGGTKRLILEGYYLFPRPEDIPGEQFESLEFLELVGNVGNLLRIIRPASEALLIPFPLLSELHLAVRDGSFQFQALAEVLRERNEVGCRLKSLLVTGMFGVCFHEEVAELEKLVDVVVLG